MKYLPGAAYSVAFYQIMFIEQKSCSCKIWKQNPSFKCAGVLAHFE